MVWRSFPALFIWAYNIYPCSWLRKIFCSSDAVLLMAMRTSFPPPCSGLSLPRAPSRGALQGGIIVSAPGHESKTALRSYAQGWASRVAEEALVPAVVCPSWPGFLPMEASVLGHVAWSSRKPSRQKSPYRGKNQYKDMVSGVLETCQEKRPELISLFLIVGMVVKYLGHVVLSQKTQIPAVWISHQVYIYFLRDASDSLIHVVVFDY